MFIVILTIHKLERYVHIQSLLLYITQLQFLIIVFVYYQNKTDTISILITQNQSIIDTTISPFHSDILPLDAYIFHNVHQ